MTVHELIEKLKEMPQDLQVACDLQQIVKVRVASGLFFSDPGDTGKQDYVELI